MESKTVNIFCDEIKERKLKNPYGKDQKWSYLGMLIVPNKTQDKLLNILKDKRCGNPDKNITWESCESLCKFHQKNNREVHYKELNVADKYHIADRWLDFLIDEDRELVYFYIFGINLNKLDKSLFGDENPYDRPYRIYNRFFRTAIQKSIKSYFHEYDKIIIDEVYHDKGDGLETHRYFPWHSIFKLKSDSKLNFNCNKITFIESDHRKSKNNFSHFIQFIDLILGSIYNALHYESKDEKKVKIAQKIVPLLDELINNSSDINSDYNHVGRMEVDFFPKKTLKGIDPDSLEYKKRRYNSFYKKRDILIKVKDQLRLF